MANFISSSDRAEFPRRAQWSPDGKCLLSASYERKLQVYNCENGKLNFTLEKKFPRNITDIVWYPLMDINEKASCAFASVCPFCPVELIDSLDGHIRAQYRVQYNGDQPASIASLEFLGNYILAGGTKTIYACDMIQGNTTTAYKCPGSVLSLSSNSSYVAAGLSTGKVDFIDSRNFSQIVQTDFHRHGVDNICWVENYVLTSAKLEDDVAVIDTRNTVLPLCFLKTSRKSSRYISISYAGNNIVIGNESGPAAVYDKELNKVGDVGQKSTPIAEISKDDFILVASGSFEQIRDEDLGIIDYQPKLLSFTVCKF